MRLAVYAGTFDPITVGHLWMIERGAELFEKLIVAIGINPEKHCMFPINERIEMLRGLIKKFPNVQIDTFTDQFLINYAQSVGARFILRGIRSGGDYEYERMMRHINSDLNPDMTTVFLMPPREIAEVSSSMVRGLLETKGWKKIVKKYVPQAVLEKIKEKRGGKLK